MNGYRLYGIMCICIDLYIYIHIHCARPIYKKHCIIYSTNMRRPWCAILWVGIPTQHGATVDLSLCL